MGSQRNNVRKAEQPDNQERSSEASTVEENVQTTRRRDRAILHARSKAEQVSDWIACTAGG
jgi:hypothetical protein